MQLSDAAAVGEKMNFSLNAQFFFISSSSFSDSRSLRDMVLDVPPASGIGDNVKLSCQYHLQVKTPHSKQKDRIGTVISAEFDL